MCVGKYLGHSSVPVKRHHDQGNSQKKAFNEGLLVVLEVNVTITAGNMAACRKACYWRNS